MDFISKNSDIDAKQSNESESGVMESKSAETEAATISEEPVHERDRIDKCGECGKDTAGLHFCDWENCK